MMMCANIEDTKPIASVPIGGELKVFGKPPYGGKEEADEEQQNGQATDKTKPTAMDADATDQEIE